MRRPRSRPTSARPGSRSLTPMSQTCRAGVFAGSLLERSQSTLTVAQAEVGDASLGQARPVADTSLGQARPVGDTNVAVGLDYYKAMHRALVAQSTLIAVPQHPSPNFVNINTKDLHYWRLASKALAKDEVDIFLENVYQLSLSINSLRKKRVRHNQEIAARAAASAAPAAGPSSSSVSAASLVAETPGIKARSHELSSSLGVPASAALRISTFGRSRASDRDRAEPAFATLVNQALQELADSMGVELLSLKKAYVKHFQIYRFINAEAERRPEPREAAVDEAYYGEIDRFVRYNHFCTAISGFIPPLEIADNGLGLDERVFNLLNRELRHRELIAEYAGNLSALEYEQILDVQGFSEWSLSLDQANIESLLAGFKKLHNPAEQKLLNSLIQRRKALRPLAQNNAQNLHDEQRAEIGFELTEEQLLAIVQGAPFIELVANQTYSLLLDISKKSKICFDLENEKLNGFVANHRILITPNLRQAVLDHNIVYALKRAEAYRKRANADLDFKLDPDIESFLKFDANASFPNPSVMSSRAQKAFFKMQEKNLSRQVVDQKRIDSFVSRTEVIELADLQELVKGGLRNLIDELNLRSWYSWKRDALLAQKIALINTSVEIIEKRGLKDEGSLSTELVRLQRSTLLGTRRRASLFYSLFSPSSKTRSQRGVEQVLDNLQSAQGEKICEDYIARQAL